MNFFDTSLSRVNISPMGMLIRRLPSMTTSFTISFPWRSRPPNFFLSQTDITPVKLFSPLPRFGNFCSYSNSHGSADPIPEESRKYAPLRPGLYLVGTPIGNLEDITFRALRVLKSANVILSEDNRHSGKLLQHYHITTSLLSYHKFNECQREQMVLRRLKQGEIVALISDAGTPGISDPGADLVKLCVVENIPVIPIPGPSSIVAAISASGLATEEFTFVGFLPKHAGSRRQRLASSANEGRTQIFFVPPHKLSQFLEETSSLFGDLRQCVMARELTKLHEEFWRGTLAEAKEKFSSNQPKGEITLLIEGKEDIVEFPSESQLEHELRDLISCGHSLSMVMTSTYFVNMPLPQFTTALTRLNCTFFIGATANCLKMNISGCQIGCGTNISGEENNICTCIEEIWKAA